MIPMKMKKSLPLAAFAGLALATGSAHGALYDEIRIGESLDDVVVPIPEPTTALLGGLGTLLLLRRRR